MKPSIFFLSIILVSCASDNNDLMTKLFSERKLAADSLRIVSAIEMDFQSKARANKSDSTIFIPLVDSSTHYYREARKFKMRLDRIEFSIDSLSKMK